jgi:hypothetical protein
MNGHLLSAEETENQNKTKCKKSEAKSKLSQILKQNKFSIEANKYDSEKFENNTLVTG